MQICSSFSCRKGFPHKINIYIFFFALFESQIKLIRWAFIFLIGETNWEKRGRNPPSRNWKLNFQRSEVTSHKAHQTNSERIKLIINVLTILYLLTTLKLTITKDKQSLSRNDTLFNPVVPKLYVKKSVILALPPCTPIFRFLEQLTIIIFYLRFTKLFFFYKSKMYILNSYYSWKFFNLSIL